MRRSIRIRSAPRLAQRGAAATEFALVLPLLLLLAFGCCDLGRAIAASICVSNAARVGAEYGATHGYTTYTYASWQSSVAQRAASEAQGSLTFDSTKLTVSVSSVPAANNLYLVTVSATYPFQMITAWPGLPQQFNLTHSVTMQRFR